MRELSEVFSTQIQSYCRHSLFPSKDYNIYNGINTKIGLNLNPDA